MSCKQTNDAYPWMSQYTQMMDAWAKWYQTWLPAVSMPRARCDIPETDCPPHCACTVTWHASRGEVRRTKIEIRNTSKDPITYQLAATAFQGCGKTIDAKPQVNPPSIAAAPGQTVSAMVEVPVGELFQPGVTYRAEVVVRGKYDRSVCLELQMRCEDEVCRFDHGEIPVRVRADDWYRHFQCTEPCFEPVQRTPNADGRTDTQ